LILAFQRDIVLISFPFSDMKKSKVRPVIVMSNDEYNSKFKDFIAMPLTSNLNLREYTIKITNKELESGNLIVDSLAKIDKIVSIEKTLARMKIGRVKKDVYKKLKNIFLDIIS
jgi:mRNA interferase MazF